MHLLLLCERQTVPYLRQCALHHEVCDGENSINKWDLRAAFSSVRGAVKKLNMYMQIVSGVFCVYMTVLISIVAVLKQI